MASITAAANGTLDVNSLVSQLVSAERATPDKRLSTQQSKTQTRLSAYGNLKSAIATLQTSLAKLKDASKLQPQVATASNTAWLGASAATTGTPAGQGTYLVKVDQLAQSQKVATGEYADGPATVIGGGQLTLTVNGQSSTLTLADDGKQNTLAGIRDAINARSDNPGVRASLLNTNGGTRLVLTSTVSGAAGRISLSASNGSTGNLSQLAFDGSTATANVAVQVAAQDARFSIDGFNFTRGSNAVSDAIGGLNLTLLPEGVGKETTVTVGKDMAATRSVLQETVTAFNALNSRLTQLTGYNASTKAAGDLQGDSTAVRLANALRQQVNTVISGAGASADTLAELGITSDAKTGALSLDAARLDTVLASTPDALTRFFTGSQGFATVVSDALAVYGKSDGLLDNRTAGLQATLKTLSSQQADVDKRMNALSQRLTLQFNNLNNLLSNLNSTSSYLSTQLANL